MFERKRVEENMVEGSRLGKTGLSGKGRRTTTSLKISSLSMLMSAW